MADIQCRLIVPEDEPAVRELAWKEFMTAEPICKALHVDPEKDSKVWMDAVFAPSIKDALTVVAVDTTTNKVVGFRFSEIVKKDQPKEVHFFKDDPKTRNVALIYEALLTVYEGHDVFAEYGVDKLVRFGGISVARSHQKRGIATVMVTKVMELAREKNIPLVTVEASSRFSRRMFEKLGFETLNHRRYEDIILDGQPLEMTEQLKEHAGISLHVKKL